MRKLIGFGVVFACILFAACDRTIVEPPRVLDFNTHPSVLRGTWSGSIADYPTTGTETKLELTNLSPSCEEVGEENQCGTYTITGQLTIGDNPPTNLEGIGYAGPGNIYALTSPLPPTGFDINFGYQGESWYLQGDYLPRETSDPLQPAFEGGLWSPNKSQSFSFRLDVHSNP